MVLWECMRTDDFMLIFKVIFILKFLKIASLWCIVFYFFNSWWSCIYTEEDDNTGVELLSEQLLEDNNILFYFEYLVLILCKYLKSLWREIYFKIQELYMFKYLFWYFIPIMFIIYNKIGMLQQSNL